MPESGMFGNLFDLNGDGKRSDFEKSLEMDYIDKMTRDVNRRNTRNNEYSDRWSEDVSRNMDDE